MNALVDSSSWIAFLREGPEAASLIVSALRDGRAALCEPVWAELWSGTKGKKEEQFLIELREACHWLTVDTETWERSYVLRRQALRSGLSCPLADILIVACARRHGAELIHNDKHIEALLKL